jgi:acyl-CoA synthetase (AMP-forming)/AMP-acid ligase II
VTGPRLVHELLDCAVRLWPERIAVTEAGRAWSHRRLGQAARGFADWLRRAGVRHGDRVVVQQPNRIELVAMVYGASLAGVVLVPVGKDVRPYQLAGIVADCEPAIVLDATWSWPVGGGNGEGGLPDPRARPSDPALLIYTSGSTARPKGVVCPHDSVLFAVDAISQRLGYLAGDTVFLRLPMSFDYGLYQAFLCAASGATLAIGDPDGAAALLHEVRRSRATVVPVVPQLALLLCQLAERYGAPEGVRLFTNTGAALTPAAANRLRAAFPGASVVSMYGLTECKRVSIGDPDGDLTRPGSVGRPLPGTTVRIVAEDGSPVPAGAVGRIEVTGPHVMAGYFRDPEQTALRFRGGNGRGGRSLRTGDYGWLDADGHLYFHARRDDIFKRKGARMSVPEIEAAAQDIDGVQAAAAIPPGDGDERLVVVVTGDVEPVAVLRGLAGRLDPARVPDRCLVLDRLPLTPAGKVDRARLRVVAEAAG